MISLPYSEYASVYNNSTNTDSVSVNLTQARLEAAFMSRGEQYTFRVRAENAINNGTYSEYSSGYLLA